MTILAFLLMWVFQSTVVVAVMYGLFSLAESGLSSYHRHPLTVVGLWLCNAIMTGAMWAVGFDGYPLLGLTLGGVVGVLCGSTLGWYVRSARAGTAKKK